MLHDFAATRNEPTDENPYPYNLADVDSISNALGIPWEPSKDVPFTLTPTFISFTWDLEQRMVSLAEVKRHKYLSALHEWSTKRTHTLHKAQELLSKLTHALQILPEGHPHLANLETMLTIFGHKPFVPHTPPKGSQDNIMWWTKRLAEQAPPAPIPIPQPPINFHMFSNASSTIGIGICIQGRWHAWTLRPGWNTNGHDIGWAEAVGFELLAHTLLLLVKPSITLLIHGNNQGVIEVWHHGCSRNKHINNIFKHLIPDLVCFDCHIITKYVPSGGNPTNPLSCSLFPSCTLLLPPILIPNDLAPFLFNHTRDPTASITCHA